MKRLLVVTLVFFTMATTYGQNKSARAVIEVDGVCGMCKERIEKASIRTKGVKSAVWSIETHELSLIYDENKPEDHTGEYSCCWSRYKSNQSNRRSLFIGS